MATWNITAGNGSLVLTLDTEAGRFSPRTITFREPSTTLCLDAIKFYESGIYKKKLNFGDFGLIDGNVPTDIENAEDLILVLIPTSGGITPTLYDLETIYDESKDLPEFEANTIHAYSLVCLTGTTTLTIGADSTVLTAGQSVSGEATTTFENTISITANTGTFLLTTITEA